MEQRELYNGQLGTSNGVHEGQAFAAKIVGS